MGEKDTKPGPARGSSLRPPPNPDHVLARQRSTATRIKVRATQDGYYDNILRRTGDVFYIDSTPISAVQAAAEAQKGLAADHPDKPAAFSHKWMEPVDDRTPERGTGPNEVIASSHDQTLKDRYEAAQAGATPAGPATSPDDDPNI